MPGWSTAIIPLWLTIGAVHLTVSRIFRTFPTIQGYSGAIGITFQIINVTTIQIQNLITIYSLKIKIKVKPLKPDFTTKPIGKIGHIVTYDRTIFIQVHHSIPVDIHKAEISRLGIAEMRILF